MSGVLTRPVLILNQSWMPIHVSEVASVVTKLWNDVFKAIDPETYGLHTWEEWIELPVGEGEPCIRTAKLKVKVPEVVCAFRYDRVPAAAVVYNARNVHKRDHHTCFPPGTLILMDDGSLKPIDWVQIGDRILDHEGVVQTVEYVHCEHTTGGLLQIRHRGNGDMLSCTPDHPILSNGKWVDAKDLRVGDLICEPDFGTAEMPLRDSCIDFHDCCQNLQHVKCGDSTLKHYCGNPVFRFGRFDYDFGRLIGYFLAEGSLVQTRTVFTFNINEQIYARDVASLIESIWGLQPSVVDIPENNKVNVICCNSAIVEILRNLCYANGEKRHVAKNFGEDYLRGVLCGVTRGDGGFNQDCSRCTTNMKTHMLIRDLYLVSQRCGIYPTLSQNSYRDDGRTSKSLVYSAEQYNRMLALCGVDMIPHTKKSKVDRKFANGLIHSKITKIDRVDYSGPVYNLQVTGSHTYVADFVCVHNCQYCGAQPGLNGVTIDHVVPKAQGGGSNWLNCVSCCAPCNAKKADRTPEQAGMKLRRQPFKPEFKAFWQEQGARVASWERFVRHAPVMSYA